MKKGLVISVLFLASALLGIIFASAAFSSETEAISAAYQCLINSTNKSSLSLEESIFTMLAVGYHNLSNWTIGQQKSPSESCWPSGACTLERTAQAGIVYDYLFRNTTGIENWLYARNGTADGISWFLEIDIENQQAASCTIRDDAGNTGTVNLGTDQKLSGTPGSCFTFARDNYFLGITTACLDRTFEIRCDENFLTATLHKKTTSDSYYVSGTTHTAVAEGTTTEKVTSKCFKNSQGACDYKGTLWAALALQHFGRDVSQFIPYIISLSDSDANLQYFPSAFLYMLTESDDAYNDITQSQQQGKFWRASANNSRFYDTAVGMLSLQGTGAQELANAKGYMLDIQDSTGCWNSGNIRDTAFILYSGWAQPPSSSSSGGSRTPPVILPNSTNAGRSQCELSGFSCSSAFACLDGGGVLKGEFACTGALECCSIKPVDKLSCSAQNGIVCSSNQRCEGRTGASSTGSCCFGSCVAFTSPGGGADDGNLCESGFYGSCKASCGSDEYDSGFSCSTPGFQCCSASTGSSTTEGGSKLWIVFILGILIILAVLGIVYKEKIKLWYAKYMTRKKTDGKPSGSMMPRPTGLIPRRLPMLGGFSPRPAARPGMRVPVKPAAKGNSEYEETLKKLREMSK